MARGKKEIIGMGIMAALLVLFVASTWPPSPQENTARDLAPTGVPRSSSEWWPVEIVSTESPRRSEGASLAVDAAGNVHLAWGDHNGYYGIFYKMRDAATGTWNSLEEVSSETTEEVHRPSLAVDAAGNVHVTWEDMTSYKGSGGLDYDIFYRTRYAMGTWSTTEVVSTESSENSRDSSVAVDKDGNVHVAWCDITNYLGAGSDWDIFYKMRNATSKTWTNAEVVSTDSTGYSAEPSLVVDSAGNVHVVWRDDTNIGGSGNDEDIFYRMRSAATGTWTSTEIISTESSEISSYPSLAIDKDGNLHLAWCDRMNILGAGTDADIFYKMRNGTSSTWTATEVVSTESDDISALPSLAVDTAGNVHVAWADETDYPGTGTHNEIFYKVKNAATGTWTITEVVSTESAGFSEYPSMDVDATGTVHVAWEDDSGPVYQIHYKMLWGSPVLNSITGAASTAGTINLFWAPLPSAEWYYVYRDTAPITSVDGLEPLARVTATSFVDTAMAAGTWHYAIVAGTPFFSSSVSNSVSVNVTEPLLTASSLLLIGVNAGIAVLLFLGGWQIGKHGDKLSKEPSKRAETPSKKTSKRAKK